MSLHGIVTEYVDYKCTLICIVDSFPGWVCSIPCCLPGGSLPGCWAATTSRS